LADASELPVPAWEIVSFALILNQLNGPLTSDMAILHNPEFILATLAFAGTFPGLLPVCCQTGTHRNSIGAHNHEPRTGQNLGASSA
jgi:hypothetical protein